MAIYQRKIVQAAIHRRVALLKELAPLLQYAGPNSAQRAKINRQRVIQRKRIKIALHETELFILTEITKDVLNFENEWPLEKRRNNQRKRRKLNFLRNQDDSEEGEPFVTQAEADADVNRRNMILLTGRKKP